MEEWQIIISVVLPFALFGVYLIWRKGACMGGDLMDLHPKNSFSNKVNEEIKRREREALIDNFAKELELLKSEFAKMQDAMAKLLKDK